MAGWQILLETLLIGLLGAMLVHAMRLERALGVIRRDRADFELLLRNFGESTQTAESGIAQLRSAADGAGRQIARQTEIARTLKDDLAALIERGEAVADRLDTLARSNRASDSDLGRLPVKDALHSDLLDQSSPRVRSQAERDLLRALKVSR